MTGITNILLIRLKSIGDILFTLPAVCLVRDNLPHARIVFLTSLDHAPLLRGFADVEDVLTIDRQVYRRMQPLTIARATLQLARSLRAGRFDWVVDFQGYGETALLTRLTGAPHRCGNVYRAGRAWAYTRAVRRPDDRHPADWNRALLLQCGLSAKPVRNPFRLPPADLDAARKVFATKGLDPRQPTLFIQPFTSSPQKNWPLDAYLALAQQCRAGQIQVLFGGGPGEAGVLGPAVAAGFPVAAGTPMLVTGGLMQLSSVIVGGDTGVVHLGVALGKRTVMLLRPVGAADAVPFGHGDWVVAPDGAADLHDIPVSRVVRACHTALSELGASLR